MAINIEKHIDHNKVRQYCIKHQLYTCGNNAEYSKMLDNCLSAENDADFLEICADIWVHTSEEYKNELEWCGGEYSDFVSGILNDCIYFTVH